jgi:hypothetical protein
MVSSGLLRATWRNNPEDTILHSHCRENLKSFPVFVVILHWHDICVAKYDGQYCLYVVLLAL